MFHRRLNLKLWFILARHPSHLATGPWGNGPVSWRGLAGSRSGPGLGWRLSSTPRLLQTAGAPSHLPPCGCTIYRTVCISLSSWLLRDQLTSPKDVCKVMWVMVIQENLQPSPAALDSTFRGSCKGFERRLILSQISHRWKYTSSLSVYYTVSLWPLTTW